MRHSCVDPIFGWNTAMPSKQLTWHIGHTHLSCAISSVGDQLLANLGYMNNKLIEISSEYKSVVNTGSSTFSLVWHVHSRVRLIPQRNIKNAHEYIFTLAFARWQPFRGYLFLYTIIWGPITELVVNQWFVPSSIGMNNRFDFFEICYHTCSSLVWYFLIWLSCVLADHDSLFCSKS